VVGSAVALSVLAAAALGGAVLLGIQRGVGNQGDLGPDYSDVVLTTSPSDLPEPESLPGEFPNEGFEETGAPLGAAAEAPDSTQYAFQSMQAGSSGEKVPVGWSPCRPIHFVVNPDGAPEGFVDQVISAFGAISVASGLVFTYDGEVDEEPDGDRADFQPERYGDRWAPVLVVFASPSEVNDLKGDATGLTITHSIQSGNGTKYIVSAEVFLDVETLQARDNGGVANYIPILRHEFGHVVGLDHVDDPKQLMYPYEIPGVLTFEDGDLAGLAQLGEGACGPDV
jgi:hypothetical protein